MHGPPAPPPSLLMGRRWKVPSVGLVTVASPTPDDIAEIDRVWRPLRDPRHQHANWDWARILRKRPEQLAVIRLPASPIAIWCSEKHKLVQLAGGRYYRPDFLEIHPSLRAARSGCSRFP